MDLTPEEAPDLSAMSNDELILHVARQSFKRVTRRGASPKKVHDQVGQAIRDAFDGRAVDRNTVNARVSAIFDYFQQGILTGVCREDAFEAALQKAMTEIEF